jgi:hypothetical protein
MRFYYSMGPKSDSNPVHQLGNFQTFGEARIFAHQTRISDDSRTMFLYIPEWHFSLFSADLKRKHGFRLIGVVESRASLIIHQKNASNRFNGNSYRTLQSLRKAS